MGCELPERHHKGVNDFIDCIEGEKLDDERLPTSNLAERCEHELDMDFQGYGTHRMVFSWDDCVVKISRHTDDHDANHREKRIWDEAPKEAREFLIPIEDSGDNWITMELYNEDIGMDEYFETKKELLDTGFDIEDMRKPNAGKRNDQIRFFDYAGYREFKNIDL